MYSSSSFDVSGVWTKRTLAANACTHFLLLASRLSARPLTPDTRAPSAGTALTGLTTSLKWRNCCDEYHGIIRSHDGPEPAQVPCQLLCLGRLCLSHPAVGFLHGHADQGTPRRGVAGRSWILCLPINHRVRPCALGRRAATVPRCTSGPFSSSKPLRGPGTWLDSRLPQNARSAPWRLCTGPGSAGGQPARPATPAASSQGASNGALPPESGRAPAPARPKLLSLWRK